ncbi:hypothetical protein [Acidithiobacillus sp.]
MSIPNGIKGREGLLLIGCVLICAFMSALSSYEGAEGALSPISFHPLVVKAHAVRVWDECCASCPDDPFSEWEKRKGSPNDLPKM